MYACMYARVSVCMYVLTGIEVYYKHLKAKDIDCCDTRQRQQCHLFIYNHFLFIHLYILN